MNSLASLRSDRWTTWPELVDDFIGIPTKKVQSISSPKRNGGGFLVGHIGRFYCHPPFHLCRFFRQTYVLGISTKSHAGRSKNLVTYIK